MTLAAQMQGVSDADEAKCDRWAAQGQTLRAAVAWRVFQGKGDILSAVTGVSLEKLSRFVKTGKIDEAAKRLLEIHQ